MSTWGIGNFENDSAADFLDRLVDQMYAVVSDAMSSDNVEKPGFLTRHGENKIMPAIAIVLGLYDQFEIGLAIFEKDNLQEWKDRYLAAYDREIHNLFNPDDNFITQRRQVIESTFNRLIALVEE